FSERTPRALERGGWSGSAQTRRSVSPRPGPLPRVRATSAARPAAPASFIGVRRIDLPSCSCEELAQYYTRCRSPFRSGTGCPAHSGYLWASTTSALQREHEQCRARVALVAVVGAGASRA